jgi:hypothetical protein
VAVRPRPRASLPGLFAAVAILAAAPGAAPADELALPSREEMATELRPGTSLSGREIYDRFLDNRFRRSRQQLRVISRDPGGSEQTTTFRLSLEDTRDENDEPTNGVRAKTLIEVHAPFDMRHTQYLMINKEPGPDDEFVYQPSERRVRRVALRKTPLMGTDYTFDDVAFHDLDDAHYVRRPDEVIDGTPVYVVEAFIHDTRDVEYHRTVSYLEMEHYVPLKVRYWDAYGVEVKVLTAPADGIAVFGDTWVATRSTMRDLLQGTSSSLLVDDMDTDPVFSEKLFTVSRMNQGH